MAVLENLELIGVRFCIGYHVSLGKVEIQDQCDRVGFLFFPEDQLKTAVGADVSIDMKRKGRRSDMAGKTIAERDRDIMTKKIGKDVQTLRQILR